MKALPAVAIIGAVFAATTALGQVTTDFVSLVQGTTGLLGYWRFDTASQANSLVNGYTGTFVGNAQLGSAGTGPSLAIDPNNRPLVLDGSGDYVTTNLTGGITTGGTVVAWVNLAVQPSTAGHFFQITGQSANGNDFDFQIESDANNSTRFYTDSGGATIYSTALPLNTWVFLTATFTANGARNIYLNGSLVATSAAGGHSTNSNPLWIGNNLVFGPRYFQGSIDEVAVFDRALTASEVANLYAAASVIPEPATTALAGGVLALAATLALRRARRPLSRDRCRLGS